MRPLSIDFPRRNHAASGRLGAHGGAASEAPRTTVTPRSTAQDRAARWAALLRRHGIQIGLVFGVFILFVLNASGVFELFVRFDEGALTFPAIVRTPEFLVLLLIGVVLSLALPMLSPIKASLLTFVSMLPVLYMGYAVSSHRPLLPMEYSLLTILMLFVVNVLISYFTETSRKQQLINAFGQYVPAELAARISQDPEQFSLEGESRELSIMFCDVHNFSAISEQLEPKELADLLNTLFTPLSRILYKHHGIIDKYMGDAIMAFWGAPLPDTHHASNAVSAAFEMQEAMKELMPRFRDRGWPEVSIGIGINTGVVSVGNMGSEYRVAYTVIGDAVNLAARLQELTRVYSARIIVGEATRRACPIVVYRELGLVQVKGKNELARIYEPCNPSTDPESTLVANMHRHNDALRCYYDRNWETAAELFR
ncbi:MAG: adenylate/guanylate cyclase domain-containing protein, partial [Kiloniellales bacterium]|nr:adenylate/guanylate cyclase domain-containing protein [Kiloniellales bacterium]